MSGVDGVLGQKNSFLRRFGLLTSGSSIYTTAALVILMFGFATAVLMTARHFINDTGASAREGVEAVAVENGADPQSAEAQKEAALQAAIAGVPGAVGVNAQGQPVDANGNVIPPPAAGGPGGGGPGGGGSGGSGGGGSGGGTDPLSGVGDTLNGTVDVLNGTLNDTLGTVNDTVGGVTDVVNDLPLPVEVPPVVVPPIELPPIQLPQLPALPALPPLGL